MISIKLDINHKITRIKHSKKKGLKPGRKMSEFLELEEHHGEEKRITVMVNNPLGFHARPAARFVEIAGKFKNCDVFVEKDETRVNGKSIMSLLLFAAEEGSKMDIIARGEEADQCLQKLAALFERNFEEVYKKKPE